MRIAGTRHRIHRSLVFPRVIVLGIACRVSIPYVGISTCKRLPDTVERPRARRDAIVNRDAHVRAAKEQLPIALPDGGQARSFSLDDARLGRHAQLLSRGGEGRINSRHVAVNDDDLGAITRYQAAQNPFCQFTAFPARASGDYDTHVHLVAKM